MKKFNKFLFVVMFISFVAAITGCADHGGETVVVKGDDGESVKLCPEEHQCSSAEFCNSQGLCVIPGANGTNGEDFERCSNSRGDCVGNELCNSQGVCVLEGPQGPAGESCTVSTKVDGCFFLYCGASVTEICDGEDGVSCTVAGQPDGSAQVECSDGSFATILPGQDGEDGLNGTSCTASTVKGCLVVTCGTQSTEICPEDLPDPEPVDGCQKDSDCTDGSECTNDICDLNTGTCRYVSQVCDDGVACTNDWCDTNGYCRSTADNDQCSGGDFCLPTGYWFWSSAVGSEELADGGCYECRWDSDCADGDACTVDTCDAGVCKKETRECPTGATCVEYSSNYYDDSEWNYVCQDNPSCSNNSQCDDGKYWTTDACVAGECVYTQVSCNDNNACTVDTVNSSGQCTYAQISCDDGKSATVDTCSANTGCVHTPVNTGCEHDLDCDDVDGTTTDLCEDNGSCTHTPNAQCKSLTVKVGWAILWSRGPEIGTTNVPMGNWRSCEEDEAENCRTMSWCGDDIVEFNVQQMPNVAGADWLVKNEKGDSPCTSNADATLNYTPADLFVGATPVQKGCSLFCDPNGYTNYTCDSAE